jgi:hypothetical protein
LSLGRPPSISAWTNSSTYLSAGRVSGDKREQWQHWHQGQQHLDRSVTIPVSASVWFKKAAGRGNIWRYA